MKDEISELWKAINETTKITQHNSETNKIQLKIIRKNLDLIVMVRNLAIILSTCSVIVSVSIISILRWLI